MRDEEEDDDVRGGVGWFATLLGAGLLLAAGFAVGVVVGSVREEPGILLRYVAGRSEDLPAPRPAPDAPVVAPVPSPPETAPAKPSSIPEAAPVQRPTAPLVAQASRAAPPQVATAPGMRFAVQVGAFAQWSEAEKLEARLRRKNLPAYVLPATGASESRWRVRVGPLETRDDADRMATRLKAQENLPVWVLEETG